MARLNDTAAIADAPSRYGEEHSIRTRKIEGGYIVTQSTCNDSTGEYRSTERFMKEPPRVTPPTVKKGHPDGPSDLAGAMSYLRDKR